MILWGKRYVATATVLQPRLQWPGINAATLSPPQPAAALPSRGQAYDANRVTLARKIPQHTSSAAVAVLTGNFTSPACFAKRPLSAPNHRLMFDTCSGSASSAALQAELQMDWKLDLGGPRASCTSPTWRPWMALTVEDIWSRPHAAKRTMDSSGLPPERLFVKTATLPSQAAAH